MQHSAKKGECEIFRQNTPAEGNEERQYEKTINCIYFICGNACLALCGTFRRKRSVGDLKGRASRNRKHSTERQTFRFGNVRGYLFTL
jgi:hypothetical protein